MSHEQQREFFRATVEHLGELREAAEIIEIGAYDVNGSLRSLFPKASRYVGVDLVKGPGVDLVSFGHRIDLPDGTFDVALSAECLEHDPFWAATFDNMARLVRPGGFVVMSCASLGRTEHGTSRTEAHISPGTSSMGLDYYANLSERDFLRALPLERLFDTHRFWYNRVSADLYFVGRRSGGPEGSVDLDIDMSTCLASQSRALAVRTAVSAWWEEVTSTERFHRRNLTFTSRYDRAVGLARRVLERQ